MKEDYKFEIRLCLLDSKTVSIFSVTEDGSKKIIDDFKGYLKDQENWDSYGNYPDTLNPDHKFKRDGSTITVDFTKVVMIEGIFKIK